MADDLDSPPPSPQLEFDDRDSEVYGHLSGLIDGVTREPLKHSTTLVALHQGSEKKPLTLLTNLTSIAEPRVLCQIVDSNGTVRGPNTLRNSHGYRLRISFDKLLLAPLLRLECIFLTSRGGYHRVGLEFHFNPFGSHDTEIQQYTHLADRITFTSKKASCFGFNKANDPDIQAKFGPNERAIIALLSSFINSETRYSIQLVLHEHLLSDNELSNLADVRARLPGGSGPPLRSIGCMEYACFGTNLNRVAAGDNILRGPKELMSKAPRHPMVSLPSSDTFGSMKEAGIELAYSALILHEEECEALKMWSSRPHRGTLLVHGKFVVVGMRFNTFPTLGSKSHNVRYRPPKELSSVLKFKIPAKALAATEQFEAFLMSNTSGLPPGYDAYFIISKKLLDHFRPRTINPRTGQLRVLTPTTMEPPSGEMFEVKCEPHIPSFTFDSQMQTVAQLQSEQSERWHPVVLNQEHSALKPHDMTEGHGVSAQAKIAAEKWLMNFMSWNKEQLEVIEGIKNAKGGLSIVVGPAGTGKTLLQQALAIYFHKLGYHIITSSPANSNANHLAAETKKLKERSPDLADVNFLRLFPGSRDHNVETMTESQAAHRQVGHEKGHALPLNEFLLAIDELDTEDGMTHDYGVVESVVLAALNRTMVLDRPMRLGGLDVGPRVNAWDVLREFIDRYRKNSLHDKQGRYTDEQYRAAYLQCKGHIIGCSRWITTTTGNILSHEMLAYWFSKEEEYGVPRVGVIVFVDEAAKDLEVNVWAAMVAGKWAAYVKGVFLLGDDKQLQPVNTSAKGKVKFNYFSDRLNISLLARLVREGFPHHRLLEQRRMHSSIAAFPNRTIYGGLLRNGPGTDVVLEMRLPGFWKALSEIIVQSTSITTREQQYYEDSSADMKLRLHWIEVDGKREPEVNANSSMIVRSHVAVFFRTIYPALREFFDRTEQKMADHIMVICGYSYALHEYENQITLLRRANPSLLKVDMPSVITVDSAQGSESTMVIFDGSFQHGDIVGFLSDRGRANVAFTRAKECFWIIGGSMGLRFPHNPEKPNLMLRYKQDMDKKNITHRFR